MTNYLVVIGDMSPFPGSQGRSIRDFTNSFRKTVAVAEVNHQQAVLWMEPRDISDADFLAMIRGSSNSGSPHDQGRLLMFCDGNIRFTEDSLDEATYRSMLTIEPKY